MDLERIVVATATALTLAAPAFAAGDRQSAEPNAPGATGQRVGQEMDVETVRKLQQALRNKGQHVGGVDGIMGPRTQAALRQYQEAQGIQVTGRVDARTLASLGLVGGNGSGTGSGATPDPTTGTGAGISTRPGG